MNELIRPSVKIEYYEEPTYEYGLYSLAWDNTNILIPLSWVGEMWNVPNLKLIEVDEIFYWFITLSKESGVLHMLYEIPPSGNAKGETLYLVNQLELEREDSNFYMKDEEVVYLLLN